MNPSVAPEISEVMDAVHYRPAVSIILPFEPKMGIKEELQEQLMRSIKKVEDELLRQYPRDTALPVLKKIHSLAKDLDYSTYKKGIAIFASPVFEKLLYLDITVEEKIIIDESFEIRDLVYCKKDLHKYLVLLLTANESRIFIGNTNTFVRIKSNKPEYAVAYENDSPQRVANFSDPDHRKEVMLDKFLKNMDDGLSIVLQAYALPLFVMGTPKILGHFKKVSKNNAHIIHTIEGNYTEATEETLRNVLKPYVNDWKKIKQEDILLQLEEARGKHKLAIGIKEVWKEAVQKKGRLLVVEKNYMCVAEQGSTEEIIYKPTEPYRSFSYIKDAVDDVMEKVLENGGDVEFVDEGILKAYDRVALINYY
jgi:Bacterial archaeo-eukaryotic release factor family 3